MSKLLCTSVVTGTVIMHAHARVCVTDTSEMAASHVCHFANTNCLASRASLNKTNAGEDSLHQLLIKSLQKADR